VKVGDLVRFRGSPFKSEDNWDEVDRYRRKGIILFLDKDNDPVVFWFDSSFLGQPEPNFRKHIMVLSEC
tara:strand:- start:3404 stop:3610 length:207 start_codon:yes stop_codon:yes gene_type:complete